MIREVDIGKKLFPDFPDMKVDFAEIGIGKIGSHYVQRYVLEYVPWCRIEYVPFSLGLTMYIKTEVLHHSILRY